MYPVGSDTDMLDQESEEWKHIRLHRCLQHTKTNLKAAAATRDRETGQRRLENSEMTPVLVSFLLQSAFLPSSCEFTVFWESVLSRLRGVESDTDWKEPRMAQYIEQSLLQQGPNGYTSAWRSGLGVVPTGFSTYSSNAQERSWRTVKGLLKAGSGVCKMICNVCRTVDQKDVTYFNFVAFNQL